MCDKAVDTYPSAIQFVPECYNTQKICDKAVDTCTFVFNLVAQEMCGKVVYEESFMLKYFLIDIRPKKYVIKLLMFFC